MLWIISFAARLYVWLQVYRQTDDLKLLKKICPVCGNAECKRHRCVAPVHISLDLSIVIYCF